MWRFQIVLYLEHIVTHISTYQLNILICTYIIGTRFLQDVIVLLVLEVILIVKDPVDFIISSRSQLKIQWAYLGLISRDTVGHA